jgi:hypothetical protein
MQRRKWVIHPIAEELCRQVPPTDWTLADWKKASGLDAAADLAALIVRVENLTQCDYGHVLDEIEEI